MYVHICVSLHFTALLLDGHVCFSGFVSDWLTFLITLILDVDFVMLGSLCLIDPFHYPVPYCTLRHRYRLFLLCLRPSLFSCRVDIDVL